MPSLILHYKYAGISAGGCIIHDMSFRKKYQWDLLNLRPQMCVGGTRDITRGCVNSAWNATCLRICDMSTYLHCVAYGHIIPYVPLISYKTVGPKHQSVAQDSSRLPCCQAQSPPPSLPSLSRLLLSASLSAHGRIELYERQAREYSGTETSV